MSDLTFPFETTVSSPSLGVAFSITNTAENSTAVKGVSKNLGGVGVFGESDNTQGSGVVGHSDVGVGVLARSERGSGLSADSVTGNAVSCSSQQATGVVAFGGTIGVQGESNDGIGVKGQSATGAGVLGESDKFDGVFGRSHSPGRAGVSGHTTDPAGLAGFFEGDVSVTGKINHGGDYNCAGNMTVQKDIVLANADCAEDFDISQMAGAEPGTVMVLGREGALEPSQRAYDKRVAGVISGAGSFRPGIVLDKQQSVGIRMPVALLGKVYCKVDAECGSVDVGDLLTTSATPGHAMKAGDPFKAFGAIIGKALRPLTSGQGLIPILVALQ
jgi:hypothetical protein